MVSLLHVSFLHDLGIFLRKNYGVEFEIKPVAVLLSERIIEIYKCRHKSYAWLKHFGPYSALRQSRVHYHMLHIELITIAKLALISTLLNTRLIHIHICVSFTLHVLIQECNLYLHVTGPGINPAQLIRCVDYFSMLLRVDTGSHLIE